MQLVSWVTGETFFPNAQQRVLVLYFGGLGGRVRNRRRHDCGEGPMAVPLASAAKVVTFGGSNVA